MMVSITRNKPIHFNRFVRGVGVFAFWIVLWSIAAHLVGKEVLLPTPYSVVHALFDQMSHASFWASIGASLARILIGYLVACITGAVVAVLCFKSSVADALLSPVLSVIRAVPVASFIILALVWIGRSNVPSFTAFLMVLPIVSANTLAGLRAADKNLLEVCKLYRFSFKKTIHLLYLPALKPYFLTAARTSLGMAWKAGIAAEVLCSLSASIGGGIYNSKLYLETPSLFAWTVVVIILSMLIEKLIFFLPAFRENTEKSKEAE